MSLSNPNYCKHKISIKDQTFNRFEGIFTPVSLKNASL
uniref:Uncharacterized protein n=1 Tax=Triticum urartu TaxID=4572 RepID=A0A8R7PED0_TRIUA